MVFQFFRFILLGSNVQAPDVSEAFTEMRLDGSGVSSMSQNIEQLIVAEEVEAREEEALHLQVILENR